MKSAFAFLALFLCSLLSYAQPATIAFDSTAWPAVLKRAQQEHKPIFVYAYAPGCRYCKKMEQTTFRDKAAATYYNDTFLAYKVNVAADTAFARRYDIAAFPTYLYFDSAGQPLHRSSGEKPTAAFLADAQAAFQPSTAFYALQHQYEAGNRTPDFLYRYGQALQYSTQHHKPQAQVLTEYLATQSAEQLKSEKNLRYIFEQNTPPADEFVVQHQVYFTPYFPADAVQKRAYRILESRARQAGSSSQNEDFKSVRHLAYTAFTDTARANATAVINFWEGRHDWFRYAQATRRYSQLPQPDSYTLRKTATYLYHFGKEQGPQKQQEALGEILNVLPVLLRQERTYESLLLAARLAQQAHRPAQARRFAQEALAQAPQEHETGNEAKVLLTTLPASPAHKQ